MKNRTMTLMVIALLLLPCIPIPAVKASHDPWDQFRIWKTVGHGDPPITNLRNYLATEHYEHLKLVLYLLLLGIYTENITNDLQETLQHMSS